MQPKHNITAQDLRIALRDAKCVIPSSADISISFIRRLGNGGEAWRARMTDIEHLLVEAERACGRVDKGTIMLTDVPEVGYYLRLCL